MTTRSRSRQLVLRLLALGVLAFMLIGYAALVRQRAFAGRVAQQVKAGVPIGTPRGVAESWAVKTFGYFTNYRPTKNDNGGLMQRAGVPDRVPGGVIEFVATPRDLVGRGIDKLRPGHVWVYLLLDEEGCVQDYRFLSFDELRQMEQEASPDGA